ncbi:MAG TPA: amino acid permease [Desulfobulbus sp.]|nr:amino acid permease [Desulfobulbus sp.]
MSASTGSMHKIGLLTLIFVTSALFMTLRNMPMMAETGMRMVFFNTVTVFAFLIPAALVAAELATGWPQNGVYHWVGVALGERMGFLAVWLQWIQSIFGITSILSYAAASFAYAINPTLASDRYFIVTVILIVYWSATLANLFGTRLSGLISSVCVTAGVFFPALVLIIWGLSYLKNGFPVHLDMSMTIDNLVPSLGSTRSLVMFLSFIFGFVGIEVSANMANEVKNVRRTYPIAVFTAAITGFAVTLLGGLAVAVVIPETKIDLISGAVQTFDRLCSIYNVPWLLPLMALLVAFGAAGQVSTWVVGPIKGLWAAGKEGNLPPFWQKVNKNGIPRNLLLLQATLISIIGFLFIFVPDINFIFLILTDIAVLLYAVMYCLMFISAIRLRYTRPGVHRAYRVPGGNFGMWVVAGTGLLTMVSCFVIGFIPYGIGTFSVGWYETAMAASVIVMTLIPFVILKFKRPEWLRT